MSWLGDIFKKNKKIDFSFDLDAFQDESNRIHMKRLAIETCIYFLGRTISQSEFRVKQNKEFVKDTLYYKLNVRPSKNVTASTFWETFVYKLIYDNECLIVKTDDDDLLIADDFQHNQYAVFEDTFSNVVVKDYEFKRTFKQSEVIHLRYRNESLSSLIDGLFRDYGELFGRILSSQKRKNQIRGTVDMDMIGAKTKEAQEQLQNFIDRMYEAIGKREVAIVPQQKGIEYKEHFSGAANGQQSVDEINKVTGGFLDQVAIAIGIPPELIHGNMADVEKQTKNYLNFTVSPLLKKIGDEANSKFFTQEEFLSGNQIDIRKPSYQSIFELATAVDKLRSSSVMDGHELRDALGLDPSDDPIHDQYILTKNYEKAEVDEGGENE